VATTALVGAGMVALAAASSMPDVKADPAALSAANLSSASTGIDASSRQANADRANRSVDRTAALNPMDQSIPDLWALPANAYTLAPPTGAQAGVDLTTAEGTPFYAAHDATVKLARWCGGFGYCVELDAGNGTTVLYGHAAKLLVQEGQTVKVGEQIGLTGNTGYSFSPRLHFEIQQGGKAINPVSFLQAQGVDLPNHRQAVDD
jgi:murein DD-endopeptidase MepM/ murein hydrolase activator NlpD